jgi:DNA repair exonuclease SbcCD ATPase subunit
MYLFETICFFVSLFNMILERFFGDRYKRLVKQLLNIYNFASKLMSIESKHENSINDTVLCLERTIEKVTALQNQIASIQRQIEELRSKSLAPIPPPPPPLPPQPAIRTSTIKATNVVKETKVKDDVIEAKRQKPSTKELVQQKGQLRTTSIRRSPGGTPLTHWRSNEVEISSPEDNAIAAVMKKALKRKFKYLRAVSPPSPIEGSPNDNEFSF